MDENAHRRLAGLEGPHGVASPAQWRAGHRVIPAAESMAQALGQLRADGLVAFPTETVWGLAARADSEAAVRRLRLWKGREENRPIALMVAAPEALSALGFVSPPAARTLIEAFWPGPLTLVLSCERSLARGIARGDGAVGVRCSSHPVAAALARVAADAGLGPLTATSLNRSGQSPARTRQEAEALCTRGVDPPYLLACADHDAYDGPPSTVVDLSGTEPEVLRWGAIGRGILETALATGAEEGV